MLFTRRVSGERAIWVDAARVATTLTPGGDFSTWTNTYKVAVADEHTGGRGWLGELHLLAVYSRALTDAEIAQNFAAGP